MLKKSINFLVAAQLILIFPALSQSIFDIVLVLCFGLVLFNLYCFPTRTEAIVDNNFVRLFVFIAVTALFSLLITEGFVTGVDEFRSRFIKTGIYFFNLYYAFKYTKFRKIFNWTVLGMVLAASIFGWLHYFGIEVFVPNNYGGSDHPFYAVFQSYGMHKNGFAMYLLFFFSILGCCCLDNKLETGFEKKLYYYLVGGTALLASLGIYFSASRTAIISLLTCIIFFIGVYVKTKAQSYYYIIGSICVVLLLTSTFLVLKVNNYTADRFVDAESMLLMQGRTNKIFPVVVSIINENPIFGVGPTNYRKQYVIHAKKIAEHNNIPGFVKPYAKRTLNHENWQGATPHNIFLQFWVRYGMVPFIVFLVFFVISGYMAIKHRKSMKSLWFGAPTLLVFGLTGLTMNFHQYLWAICLAINSKQEEGE